MVCCAYHYSNNSYYTFSDFFIQHPEETPPQGIEIHYYIAHNRWKKTTNFPEGIGIGHQRRWKNQNGRWNNYASRVHRKVIFLGIGRIVPHSERSHSRSYSRRFKDADLKGWENKVKSLVGHILDKTYEEFRYLRHTRHTLPLVKTHDAIYTGLNMGAGENALFEIFSALYSNGEGSLLVIDELELGLHIEAQKKFVNKLKEVCQETKSQIICTTHSKEIFDCLPLDARFFIESVNGKTTVTDSISSDYAFSKLSAIGGIELDLYVEDEVAKCWLLTAIPTILRSRLTIHVFGSASALMRLLAVNYTHKYQKPFLIILDGDQRKLESDRRKYAKGMTEKCSDDFEEWFQTHVAYIPGDTWPEKWIVERGLECLEKLSVTTNTASDELKEILHNGFELENTMNFLQSRRGWGSTSLLHFNNFVIPFARHSPMTCETY